MVPIFLTVVVLLMQPHVGFAVTLPQPYDSIDKCWDGKDKAIAEWTAGTPFPFRILNETCRVATEAVNPDERRAPEHLRDIKVGETF